MNDYYFIQRNKSDGQIIHLVKIRLDKSKSEVVELIERHNNSSVYNFKTELIEDEKMIELFCYAKKMESNAELKDILDSLRDIESTIERYIWSKK